MNTVERTRTAFLRGTPDRVPVHCWLGLPYFRARKPADTSMHDLLHRWIDDPVESIVKAQEELGLDPMVSTYSQHIGEIEIYPRMLMSRPYETDDWIETFEEIGRGEGWREHRHAIRTPDGELDYSYRTEDGFGTSCHDFLLKGDHPEEKLAALRHFPPAELYDLSPIREMVGKVGDRAWWLHHVPGPWDMAASVRGLVDLSMDVYDRPQFVHDLMRVCTDWLVGHYRQLGTTGIHSVSMNETWVGVGVARDHFVEFMKPYETEVVAAAHDAGYLVSFHNCGRAILLLEDMADTNPDAVETLTSSRSSGDVDLAEAKRRIGDRVCLFGGLDEHLLRDGDEASVVAEVHRCLDAAMEGGGYIVRSTGQIFDAKPGLIELMCDTVHKAGTYN